MEEVLILSYYFPPANLPASFRVYSWARYLSEYGYYPVVVTRKWNGNIEAPADLFRASTPELIHKKEPFFEAYYLPYTESWRDRIYLKHGEQKNVFLRKTLSFIETISWNYTNYLIQYKSIYEYSRQILKERPHIRKVIISANPFQLFRFGYLLQREFDVQWVADFRDEWSTTDWDYLKSGIRRINFELEKRSERKWIKSAAAITSVTPYFAEKLGKFHDKPSKVVYNGFFEEESAPFRNLALYEDFTFTFAGTLYDIQKIDLVLDVINKLIVEFRNKITVKVRFPGLGFEASQRNRIEKIFESNPSNVIITPRVSKKEILEIQGRSHVLLLPSMGELKGNIQSKVFDYISLYKPIVLFPSDEDVLQKIVVESGLGIMAESTGQLYHVLKDILEKHLQKIQIGVKPDTVAIANYSRQKQTGELAALLDTM